MLLELRIALQKKKIENTATTVVCSTFKKITKFFFSQMHFLLL